ncbi:cytochrome P450 monooxygenase 11, partial [Ceratobasidium sp. UAMH 11750]
MPNPRVFFNFEADQRPLGRVVFELFRDDVPKTVENFRALATGEKGLSQVSQVPLYYKGCIIHRSIDDFMIQGGDFTKRNGTGGESIYGHPFEDENFDRDVDAGGLLVMANRGPNTNSSQFFITVRPCPHLNGKHVVFGRVVAGLDIVKQISKLPVDEKSRPLKPVVIASCGELELRKAPPKPREPTPESRSASATPSDDSDDDRRRSKKHKSKRRSSRSPDASKSKSKSKKHKSRRDEEEGDGLERKDFGGPRKETEE